MKASFLKTSFILLLFFLSLVFIVVGDKKETPPPQELTAEEKEFLSAPDAVTFELEKIKISKMDLPKSPEASNFFNHMNRLNRHYVKQTQITLANRPFKIILGFHPEREFFIYDIEKKFSPYWSGSESLHSYHKIDDKLYEFMLIENGTKIAARPYKGPLGIIKIGKGGRELETAEFIGSLKKDDYVAVPVGTLGINQSPMMTECAIPVGDYIPYRMYVTYDSLLIEISSYPYTGPPGWSSRKDTVYGIHIREDKPYVLDFSNEPKVIFGQPSMSQTTFSRGREINFAAVLIDQKSFIMIQRLDDRAVKVDKELKYRDGKVIHTKANKSLAPNVVIARAGGEVVAESAMPFNGSGTCRYTWRVPDDLEINGDEEEFTVRVTYKTQKLYGIVTEQRKIKIRK